MMIKDKFYNSFFGLILGIQFLYLGLSMFIPQLPGWKMFAEVEHVSIQITNDAQNEIPYSTFMATVYYNFSKTHALSLTKFLCQKKNNEILYLNINKKERYEFKKPNCEARKN